MFLRSSVDLVAHPRLPRAKLGPGASVLSSEANSLDTKKSPAWNAHALSRTRRRCRCKATVGGAWHLTDLLVKSHQLKRDPVILQQDGKYGIW